MKRTKKLLTPVNYWYISFNELWLKDVLKMTGLEKLIRKYEQSWNVKLWLRDIQDSPVHGNRSKRVFSNQNESLMFSTLLFFACLLVKCLLRFGDYHDSFLYDYESESDIHISYICPYYIRPGVLFIHAGT